MTNVATTSEAPLAARSTRAAVRNGNGSLFVDSPGASSPPKSDFERWLDDLSSGLPTMPSLSADFSRKDVYPDDEA